MKALSQVKDPRHQSYTEYDIEEILYTMVLKNIFSLFSMQERTYQFNQAERVQNVCEILGKSGKLYEEDGEVMGARASKHQYKLIKKEYPEVQYDEISWIIKIEKSGKKKVGKIAVCLDNLEITEVIVPKLYEVGAGKRTYDRPSMLRAMLIKDKSWEEL